MEPQVSLLYENDMNNPVCKVCHEPVTRYIKSKNKWWDWCSNKCMGKDPEILAKKQQTNLIKFGNHPMKITEFKEKQKATIFKNHGVDNPSKSKIVQDKMKETFIRNYGVDNPSKNEEIVEKIRAKAIKKYETDKEQILEKRSSTNFDKYGVKSKKQLHLSADSIKKMKDVDWLVEQHITLKKSCEQIARELGCSPTPILTFLTNSGVNIIRHNSSIEENELREYVESLTSDVIIKDRNIIAPHELDIVLPTHKLAFEMNGVYWHSELRGKDKNYHLSKTKRCASNNIMLWHIYDIEWNNRREIVKSKIEGALHLHTKVPARKCIIKNVSKKEKSAFLNTNHLQGTHGSKVDLGLYFNDELVMIATFGKPRYNKKYEWELIRLCSKLYTTVQGGANKLFQHFIKTYNPSSIISYADARWSNGNIYYKLNFKYSHTSAPDYFYFKNPNILESRVKYQKHKLYKLFNLPTEINQNEWEIMQQQGYNRIWDCGNMVFTWTK